MGARKMIYGLTVKLRDKASRGLKSVADKLDRVRKASRRVTRGGGLGGMLSGGLGGGIASATAAGGPQSGIGGMISGVMKGATKLLTMPVKILSSFTRIIPGIGGVFSGILGTATNALQSIANVAANVVGSVVNAFASMAKSIVKVFGKILKTATRVFGKISMVAGGAFVAGTGAAVKFAGNVEDAWNKVRSIIDLGPAADRIRMQLRDLATRTGRGLKEIMEGYYQTISAGFKDPAKAMEVMRSSLKGAVGGAANFGTVVKTVSRTMRNFGDAIKSPREAMDVLLKTVDVGQIEMPELANVFGRVANAAGMVGAKFRETAAALGVMAQTGPAEVVATQLRGFFLALTKPTKQAMEAMQELKRRGIDVTAKALKRMGLVRYLKRLQNVPKGVLAKIFSDRRALMGVNTLMKMLPNVEDALGDLRNAAGKTASNFGKVMNSINKQAARAWQGVKDLALEYAQPISDMLKRWLKAVPAELKQWRPAAKAAGEAVAGALETALQKGKQIYQYLASIDWSQAWSGLKKLPGELASNVLPKIQALFGQMTEEGFEPGPVLNALVSAFQWAAAKIEGILSALWERVGRDLTQTIMDAMAEVGRSLQEHIMSRQEAIVKQWYEEEKTGAWGWLSGAADLPEWDELNQKQKDAAAQGWAKRHSAQARIQQAGLRIGEAMSDAATAMRPRTLSDEQQREAEAKAKKQADKKAAEAANKLSKALSELADQARNTVQAAGKEVDEALPKKAKDSTDSKAEHKPAKTAQKANVEEVTSSKSYSQLQTKLQRAQRLADSLDRTGYGKKAENKQREVKLIRMVVDAIKQQAKKTGMTDDLKRWMRLAARNPERAAKGYTPEQFREFEKTGQVGASSQQTPDKKLQENGADVAAETAQLRNAVTNLLENVLQDQAATKKELKGLKRQVKALNHARA